MNKAPLPASFFGMVLGLSGLGQAWRLATDMWSLPAAIGEAVLLVACAVWATLLVRYLWQALRHTDTVRNEFMHPVQGSTPALLAVAATRWTPRPRCTCRPLPATSPVRRRWARWGTRTGAGCFSGPGSFRGWPWSR